MRRTYKFLLLLYPRDHRDRFAEEMALVFEEASQERRAERWTWFVRFAFAEIAGVIGGAAQAWMTPERHPEVQTASSGYLPPELAEAQQCVDANVAALVHAIANHQFEEARNLSDQEREARERLRVLRQKYAMNWE